MANQEQYDILKQGVEAWNQWREEHPDVWLDFSGAFLFEADLRGANLSRVSLREADLEGADLEEANLKESDLGRANLSRANLSGANLSRANLSGANLSRADLKGANLGRASLSAAKLSNADLEGADLSGAELKWADLRGAKLHGADLSGANLFEAMLSGAALDRANLREADLSGTSMLKYEREQLRSKGAVGLDKVNIINEPSEEETLTTEITPTLHKSRKLKVAESTSTLYIRITQQPLTARNLAITTSTLTQLHTQFWLIAIGRFADLIEYAQTHNPRFDEEANFTIAQMAHQSPAEIKFNVSLEGVANALRSCQEIILLIEMSRGEMV
jgi:Pentapeptide repeats (8 copies)